MRYETFLSGKQTFLRPPKEEDAPLLVSWMNNEVIRKNLMRWFPITIPAEIEWILSNSKQVDHPTNIVFMIETKQHKPIGIMGLHSISWIDRHATTGTVIGATKLHNKGIATDAKLTLLGYAFDTLGLHKVMSRAVERNHASIAYSKKCGYKIEGILKEDMWKDGTWHNTVLLACFRENWKAKWDAHNKK